MSRHWLTYDWKIRVLHVDHAYVATLFWSCQPELLDRLYCPFCQSEPKKHQFQVFPWTGLQIAQCQFVQFLCRHFQDAAWWLKKRTAVNFPRFQRENPAGKPREMSHFHFWKKCWQKNCAKWRWTIWRPVHGETWPCRLLGRLSLTKRVVKLVQQLYQLCFGKLHFCSRKLREKRHVKTAALSPVTEGMALAVADIAW